MTRRKHTPIHDFWHPRVEGQIRDAMKAHPEWFACTKPMVVNSMAKRIVGEIAAAVKVAAMPDGVALGCAAPVGAGGGCSHAASREGGGCTTAPLPQSRWVSIEDRLPESPRGPARPMLVAYKPLLGKRKVTVAIFTPHGWKFPLGRFHSALSERVTHWQPFPEPPGKA